MPYMEVWVDDPNLSDADEDDLIAEMERRGFCVSKGLRVDGIGRIEHLTECGLFRDAATEALQLIEHQIGKPGVLTRAH